jgi:hypothetical protein
MGRCTSVGEPIRLQARVRFPPEVTSVSVLRYVGPHSPVQTGINFLVLMPAGEISFQL